VANDLYLEDIRPGDRLEHGSVSVDAAAIQDFARAFDPQPFHVDPAAAEATLFRGLAASGWHTAALTMRLLVESGAGSAWGIIGREVERLEWPRPTRPGDTLSIRTEVLETRPSRSRPEMGIVRVRTDTLNQRGEVVQTMVSVLVAPRRGDR
jgi:acyl dehydratase